MDKGQQRQQRLNEDVTVAVVLLLDRVTPYSTMPWSLDGGVGWIERSDVALRDELITQKQEL